MDRLTCSVSVLDDHDTLNVFLQWYSLSLLVFRTLLVTARMELCILVPSSRMASGVRGMDGVRHHSARQWIIDNGPRLSLIENGDWTHDLDDRRPSRYSL